MYKYEHVKEGNDSLFLFSTKKNNSYRVSFLDKLIEFDSNILQQNLFEISIERFLLNPKEKDSSDGELKETILEIIAVFLSDNPNAILQYICDSFDGKQEARNSLFNKWFEKEKTSNWVKYETKFSDPTGHHDDIQIHFIYNSEIYSSYTIQAEITEELKTFERYKLE